MNKGVLFVALITLFAGTAHSQGKKQIKNFSELMASLENGSEVNAVLHYAKCDLQYFGGFLGFWNLYYKHT